MPVNKSKMQKNNELTEKEVIVKNFESSKNIKEVAEKGGFSIATLYNRLDEYELDLSFAKRGRPKGGRKVAKLG